MNTIYKFLAIAFISSAFFASCAVDENMNDREPSPASSGSVFIFDNTPSSVSFVPSDEQKFVIKVGRDQRVAESAATINLEVDDPDEVFTVPATVTFGAGATEAEIPVTFDFQLGQRGTLTVGFAKSDAYDYGRDQCTINVLRDYVWLNMGMVEYHEEDFELDKPTLVPIQRAEGTNNYRLADLYHHITVANEDPDVIPPGLHLPFTLDDDYNAVSLPDGFTDLGTGYEVYWNTTNYAAYCTFKNNGNNYSLGYLLTPNRSSLYIGSASFIWVEGYPGSESTDYSISLSYLGHYIDMDDVDNAIVRFTKGADAASYQYAVVNESLNAAAAAAVAGEIIAGTISTEEDTEGGYKLFPFEEPGKYSIVAVTFDENGEAQEFDYVSFEFIPAGMDNPWVSLGFCEYTDDVLIALFSDDPDDVPTYDVEILEHRDTPGLFRLKNAYGAGYPYNDPGDYVEGNVYIEIDATDPEGVYIDYQSMGVDWGFGNMYIYSLASYYMDKGDSFEAVKAAGLCGTYENKIITFPVDALLIADDDGFYQVNPNGMWKVDMTSLRASATKSASLRSGNGLIRSHSQEKAPFSLKSIMPVRIKGQNVPASVIRNNTIMTIR